MFKNYFKTSFRNLWKNSTYSFLNISGLAIGIACAGLIFLWVEDELTFDHYFNNRNNLYKVKDRQTYDGTTFTFDATPGLMAPAMKVEIPGIKNTARSSATDPMLLFSLGDKAIYEKGNYVDSSFFSMFQFHFINGNPANAFKQLYSIVVTEKMAKQFFNSTDVIGKTLKVNNEQDYVITGVIKSFPENVSIKFDWLAPFQIYEKNNSWLQQWGSNGVKTYVELHPNADTNAINKKLHDYITTKTGGDAVAKMSVYPMSRWRLHDSYDANGKEKEGQVKYLNLLNWDLWNVWGWWDET